MSKLTKTEVFAKDIFCAVYARWQSSNEILTVNKVSELLRWSTHLAMEFVQYLETAQESKP